MDEDEDPTGLMSAWPRPGQGLHAKLQPESMDDFMEDDDDVAFSSTVYGSWN